MKLQLTPFTIILVVAIYFLVLSGFAWWTGRKSNTASFYNGNKNSPWYLVAIGMIGASLSGVTFISIPGKVGDGISGSAFAYMQMVFGFLVGYIIIAQVLLPIYYRSGVTSIYEILGKQLGQSAQTVASGTFILSRTVGASLRLFLIAMVLHTFVMQPFGVPFYLTVLITIVLIWIYTFQGGIKTIVWTDTLQTIIMLCAVLLTIYYLSDALDMTILEGWHVMSEKGINKVFFFENGWGDARYFFKMFIGGILITLTMTGLDQDMMQKNLTCKNIGEAKKNMYTFSLILLVANLIFLTLGGLLYLFAQQKGIDIPATTDHLYPTISLYYLPPIVGILFIVGLIAAAYSSADSALTSLTTAFCLDFLKITPTDSSKRPIRILVHIGFSLVLFFIILYISTLDYSAIIDQLFKAAGYTYGPLLGMFVFAIYSNRSLKKKRSFMVLIIAICSILKTYYLDQNSETLFNGFTFGFTTLLINGALTYLGLFCISHPKNKD